MLTFIWVIFWLVVAVAFVGITVYLVTNIISLRKCTTSNFIGQPVETDAVVTENSLVYYSTVKSASTAASEKLNCLTLQYKVDGVTYTKEVQLIDVHQRLKKGDIVQVYYDDLDSGHALLADGSEAQSAKNGIKWAIGYYCILFIVGAFLFFKIALAFE